MFAGYFNSSQFHDDNDSFVQLHIYDLSSWNKWKYPHYIQFCIYFLAIFWKRWGFLLKIADVHKKFTNICYSSQLFTPSLKTCKHLLRLRKGKYHSFCLWINFVRIYWDYPKCIWDRRFVTHDRIVIMSSLLKVNSNWNGREMTTNVSYQYRLL